MSISMVEESEASIGRSAGVAARVSAAEVARLAQRA